MLINVIPRLQDLTEFILPGDPVASAAVSRLQFGSAPTNGDSGGHGISMNFSASFSGKFLHLQKNGVNAARIENSGEMNLVVDGTGANNGLDCLVLSRRTASAPAAGLGCDLQYEIQTSDGTLENCSYVRGFWGDATTATKQGALRLSCRDTTDRTGLEVGCNGGAATIGVLGAPRSPRIVVTGSRGANAALASLLTAMATFGWITDSTSA